MKVIGVLQELEAPTQTAVLRVLLFSQNVDSKQYLYALCRCRAFTPYSSSTGRESPYVWDTWPPRQNWCLLIGLPPHSFLVEWYCEKLSMLGCQKISILQPLAVRLAQAVEVWCGSQADSGVTRYLRFGGHWNWRELLFTFPTEARSPGRFGRPVNGAVVVLEWFRLVGSPFEMLACRCLSWIFPSVALETSAVADFLKENLRFRDGVRASSQSI